MRSGKLIPCALTLAWVMLGSSGVWGADRVTEDRLNALIEAVGRIGASAARTEITTAKVCWAPDSRYSPAGQASEVPYGVRCIVAQYDYKPIMVPKTIKAVWTKDKAIKPLLVTTVQMHTDAASVTNSFIQTTPLAPGYYHVRFVDNGRDLAYGRIKVLAPAKLGGRKANDVYVQGLRHLQTALGEIDAGKAHHAHLAANKALPLLASAMAARPKDANTVAAHELTYAIIGVGKMNALATQNVPDKVVDWAKRSLAHSRASQGLAKDAGLKSAARSMADTIARSLPDIEKAARQGQ